MYQLKKNLNAMKLSLIQLIVITPFWTILFLCSKGNFELYIFLNTFEKIYFILYRAIIDIYVGIYIIIFFNRWQGPVSIALYTPGSDYEDAMKAVSYYRLVLLLYDPNFNKILISDN